MTIVVTQAGGALVYASRELRNNDNVVIIAVTQNGHRCNMHLMS